MMLRYLTVACVLGGVPFGCSSNTEVARDQDAGTGNSSSGGSGGGGAGSGGSAGSDAGAAGSGGGAAGIGGGTAGSAGTGGGAAGASGSGGGVARSWGAVERFGMDATQPDVAVHNGNAVVVWADAGGAMARRYDGAAWATAIPIDPRAGVDQVRVGVDADGHFVAVWQHYPYDDDMLDGVYASRSLDGTSWAPAIPLHNGVTCCDIVLDVADDGSARAVWEEIAQNPNSTSGNDVQTSLWTAYFDGTNWAPAEVAASAGANENSSDDRRARIVSAASGQGLILWHQANETELTDSVWWRAFSGATLQAQPAEIENYTGSTRYSNIAMNASGAAIAAWVQDTSTDAGLFVNRYDPLNGWIGPEPITRAYAIRDLALAVASDGSATLLYSASVQSFMQLHAVAFTPGAGWQTAMPLEAGNMADDNFTDQLLYPELALDAANNVIAVWTSATNEFTWGVHARTFNRSAGAWTEASLLGRHDNLRAWLPQVDADAEGRAMAVWYYSDITDEGLGSQAERWLVNAAAYR